VDAKDEPKAKAVAAMLQKFGGREAFFGHLDKRYAEFTRIWNQDSERMGRILRAHLAVEHFVGIYLCAMNANLGDVAGARLSFAQKVDLLKVEENGMIAMILPGLRRLGAIRNRIAHRLHVDITKEDEGVFLAIGLFNALRDAKHGNYLEHPEIKPIADNTAVALVEEFAQFASGLLHAAADPNREVWGEAMKAFAPDPKAAGEGAR
jgi:hypothetical protein